MKNYRDSERSGKFNSQSSLTAFEVFQTLSRSLLHFSRPPTFFSNGKGICLRIMHELIVGDGQEAPASEVCLLYRRRLTRPAHEGTSGGEVLGEPLEQSPAIMRLFPTVT